MLKLILLLFWVDWGSKEKCPGAKYSDPLTPSGGPFRYRGPSDHLGLNPCLSPQIVDGFFYISIEHHVVDLTRTRTDRRRAV